MASAPETTKSVDKNTLQQQQQQQKQQKQLICSSTSSVDHKKNVVSSGKLSSHVSQTVSSSVGNNQPSHSVLVTTSDASNNPSRVLGWKSSKTFSKTMSSIEVAPVANQCTSSLSKPLTKQQSISARTYHMQHHGGSGSLASGNNGSGAMAISASQPRAAAIRIQMAESVGPSAYSLSLQQRNASDQWKLLKNRLLRKKSNEEDESPAASFPEVVMDRMRQMRRMSPHQQELSTSTVENGIVCRTNELKKLLKTDGDTSGRNSTRSSFDAAISSSTTGTTTSSVTCTTSTCDTTTCSSNSETQKPKQPSSSSSSICSPSPPIVVCEANVTEAESSSSPLLSSSSSSSAVESTVKWDESNVLDAAVLGDAIQDFLKRLQCSSPTKVSGEKKVSFR